jgi:four helix bundle protein
MKATCFEDLKIWKEARELSKEIYVISRLPEFSKDYRFVGQITSAAGSIMDNIAEGFERDGNKEFLQFLSIAKGSCGELRSQIYRAYDAGYINEEKFETLVNNIKLLSASIFYFMKNLKSSDMVGKKYKEL